MKIEHKLYIPSGYPPPQNEKLCVFLHDIETLSLTLSRAFENSVLCKIFGPKKGDVTMDWRKLHNKYLHELQSSPNIMRV